MPDWHHEDIKAELRKRGGSLADIARQEGVSRSALSRITRKGRSRRLEKAIAQALGIQPEEIWPSRYPRNGNQS